MGFWKEVKEVFTSPIEVTPRPEVPTRESTLATEAAIKQAKIDAVKPYEPEGPSFSPIAWSNSNLLFSWDFRAVQGTNVDQFDIEILIRADLSSFTIPTDIVFGKWTTIGSATLAADGYYDTSEVYDTVFRRAADLITAARSYTTWWVELLAFSVFTKNPEYIQIGGWYRRKDWAGGYNGIDGGYIPTRKRSTEELTGAFDRHRYDYFDPTKAESTPFEWEARTYRGALWLWEPRRNGVLADGRLLLVGRRDTVKEWNRWYGKSEEEA